jgi:hypothetical protein
MDVMWPALRYWLGHEANHSPPSSAEVRVHGVVLSLKKNTGTTLPFILIFLLRDWGRSLQ